MSDIVLGFGTSHSPLLILEPKEWEFRADFDRENSHPFRGGTYNFQELCAARADEDFVPLQTMAERQDRFDRCQSQLDALGAALEEADPDLILLVGDDHREWYMEDFQPAFAVYHGDEAVNRAPAADELAALPAEGRKLKTHYYPPENQAYPVAAALGQTIIERAMADEFDVASTSIQPRNDKGTIGVGHAYAYVYRRILKDKPVPLVPVLINTYFPPNQPAAKRCFNFGRSIGRALRTFGEDLRIAVGASGGLSHFVVDEDFDTRMLGAMEHLDTGTIFNEPEHMFQSGTSETKNWITVAGILAEQGMTMNLLDYVPCYRTEAGTGCGMAFATWN